MFFIPTAAALVLSVIFCFFTDAGGRGKVIITVLLIAGLVMQYNYDMLLGMLLQVGLAIFISLYLKLKM